MRSLLLIAIVATVTVCLGLAATCPKTEAQVIGANTSKTWEYKVVHVTSLVKGARELDAVVAELEKGLNRLGADRWELCQDVNGGLVFKRQK